MTESAPTSSPLLLIVSAGALYYAPLEPERLAILVFKEDPLTQLVAISPVECPQREKAIDAGHARVRLEGLILNDIVEAIHAQHVAWFREK